MDASVTPIHTVTANQPNPALSSVNQNNGVNRSQIIPWLVSSIISFILLLVILVVMPMEPWYWWKGVVAQYITGGEYIIAEAGTMGDDYFDIIIHKAYLRKPGWIVVSAVYFANDKNCSEIFGTSKLLPAGKVSEATIRVPNLHPTELEDTTNQPALPPGNLVTINIAYDTEDSGVFNYPTFVKDRNGDRIFATARIGETK